MDETDSGSSYKLMAEKQKQTDSTGGERRMFEEVTENITENATIKKGLISLNSLNDRLIKTNGYYVVGCILLYVTIGVAVYHHWLGWNRLDSLYFVMMTCLTVGYGDYAPVTSSERVFTSFYIIVGIAVCGSMVGVVFTFLSEHNERMAKQRNLRSFRLMKELKRDKEVEEERGEMSPIHTPRTDASG